MLTVSPVMDGWWQIRHTKVLMDTRVHQVAEMTQSLSELLRKPVRDQTGPDGGGSQGGGGGMAVATGVCFKLFDAVNQEWNALERGFLCPCPQGGTSGDGNFSFALQAGIELTWAVQAPVGSHICFPGLTESCAVCWGQGRVLPSRGANGTQTFLLLSVSFCL